MEENIIEVHVEEKSSINSKAEASSQTEATACAEVEHKIDIKIQIGKKQQFLQILKFTCFSISAGVIQLVSDGILCDWTHWLPWWPAYLISVILSVIWNFTFNRKFTFKAANNVPLAMGLVLLYYCAFIPVSVFGGDAIAARLPENLGLLVTFMMMLVNFVTEFLWDKFVVFNSKVTDKILNKFKSIKIKKTDTTEENEQPATDNNDMGNKG